MSKKRFGDFVRERREELGLNQNQLALKAKLNRTTLNNLEANATGDVKAETLFKLAKALHWDGEQVRNAYHGRNPNDSTEKRKKELIYQAAMDFIERATRHEK